MNQQSVAVKANIGGDIVRYAPWSVEGDTDMAQGRAGGEYGYNIPPIKEPPRGRRV